MKKNIDNITLIISLSFFVIIGFLTFGYAFNDEIVTFSGKVNVLKSGEVKIASIILDSSANNTLPEEAGSMYIDPDDGTIKIDYTFTATNEVKEYDATYLIEVENDSALEYIFSNFSLVNIDINVNGESSMSTSDTMLTYEFADTSNSTISIGDSIGGKKTEYLAIKLHFVIVSSSGNEETIGIGGGAEVSTDTENVGSFYGTLVDKNIDLRGNNTIDCFNIKMINTFDTTKTFSVSSSKSNFIFVNSGGSTLSNFTIPAGGEGEIEDNEHTYTICAKVKSGSIFKNDTDSTSVVISNQDMGNFSIGTLNIQVDKSEEKDTEPPIISDVHFSVKSYDVNNNTLTTNLSWNSTDKGSISKYYIRLYDANNSNMIKEFEVSGDAVTSNYDLVIDSQTLTDNKTNMVNNNHNYYVKIYGVDGDNNSGINYNGHNYCDDASNNYCSSSTNISLKYEFNISISGTNVGFKNNSTTIYLYQPFEETINVTAQNYKLDNTVSATMGGTNFTNYTFTIASGDNPTEGTFSIPANQINGDVVVTASATYVGETCLMKGTKVKLANGKYKNIEDINYTDLISAYSYELGREVYTYPIEIKNEAIATSYQRTTFSDGSILETYGTHGIFSVDDNMFVSVLDNNRFHVGTRVYKIINNKLKIVSVIKIENINEVKTYYHVTSTRYLNAITNDFITTDAILPISNIYKFDSNMMWSKERDEYLKTNNLFKYEDLKDYFPSHFFYGIRLDEAKYLVMNNTINIPEYVSIFNHLDFKDPIKDNNGNNLWMVSTTSNSGKLYKEGSYYTLDMPKLKFGKKFIGYLNTSDNKYYQVGDKVELKYGIYFEEIWK